nr:hypothetical protein [uncultured Methanoregula sp.]
MRPLRIPPMITDLIITAVSAFDGAEFTKLAQCPFCGGAIQGYDTRKKKFAVLTETAGERTITVYVRRFTCRSCKKLCYADEPFYPDTRIGSIIIDLHTTLSTLMPPSRAARVIDVMGIRVDRTTWRNYRNLKVPDIPTAEVFGMRLPRSILTISTIAARIPEGSGIEGAEALAACGFPSTYRAAPHSLFPPKKRDDRDDETKKEERQTDHP